MEFCKPDIVVTYPWGMDLRRDLPRFLERLYWRLRRSGRVASWEEFVGKTFWLDILFNDQNSKDIVQDLNAAQKIYEEAWVHALLVMRDPLSRGWILFELGVRVWAVGKEFGLDHAATLRLLRRAHAAGEDRIAEVDDGAQPPLGGEGAREVLRGSRGGDQAQQGGAAGNPVRLASNALGALRS